MELDTESKLYIEAKGLPSTEILGVSFLPADEFYSVTYENEEYLIVGDEDAGMSYIGLNKYGNVYLIGLDTKMYISNSLVKFAKQLLAFQSFALPAAKHTEKELKVHANKFRETIKGIDKSAFKNDGTFWAGIIKHIEEVLRY